MKTLPVRIGCRNSRKNPQCAMPQWLELAAHTWPAYSESLVGHAGLGDFEGQKGQLGTNVECNDERVLARSNRSLLIYTHSSPVIPIFGCSLPHCVCVSFHCLQESPNDVLLLAVSNLASTILRRWGALQTSRDADGRLHNHSDSLCTRAVRARTAPSAHGTAPRACVSQEARSRRCGLWSGGRARRRAAARRAVGRSRVGPRRSGARTSDGGGCRGSGDRGTSGERTAGTAEGQAP